MVFCENTAQCPFQPHVVDTFVQTRNNVQNLQPVWMPSDRFWQPSDLVSQIGGSGVALSPCPGLGTLACASVHRELGVQLCFHNKLLWCLNVWMHPRPLVLPMRTRPHQNLFNLLPPEGSLSRAKFWGGHSLQPSCQSCAKATRIKQKTQQGPAKVRSRSWEKKTHILAPQKQCHMALMFGPRELLSLTWPFRRSCPVR